MSPLSRPITRPIAPALPNPTPREDFHNRFQETRGNSLTTVESMDPFHRWGSVPFGARPLERLNEWVDPMQPLSDSDLLEPEPEPEPVNDYDMNRTEYAMRYLRTYLGLTYRAEFAGNDRITMSDIVNVYQAPALESDSDE